MYMDVMYVAFSAFSVSSDALLINLKCYAHKCSIYSTYNNCAIYTTFCLPLLFVYNKDILHSVACPHISYRCTCSSTCSKYYAVQTYR